MMIFWVALLTGCDPCSDIDCINGNCNDGTCECYDGYYGTLCDQSVNDNEDDDDDDDNQSECEYIQYSGNENCPSGEYPVPGDCCPEDFPYYSELCEICALTCQAAEAVCFGQGDVYLANTGGSSGNGQYSCSNGTCIENNNGPYATLGQCQAACGDPSAEYDCVNGNCVPSTNGQFTTLSECQSNCSGPIPTGCDGISSITDGRDGQTYQIVQIGNQCWFAENLNYAGNFTVITTGQDWVATADTEEPAWCFYNFNSSNESTYGKLYNWYAVDTEELCPSGWRVPTAADWSELISYLGGQTVAGGKMKSVTGWNSPNTGATNESGFTALPGGYRSPSTDGGVLGGFQLMGTRGYFWRSGPASSIELDYGYTTAYTVNQSTVQGVSCRCVMD